MYVVFTHPPFNLYLNFRRAHPFATPIQTPFKRSKHAQIAWLRVDTQTILTIQSHVITKNHRMIITHAEKRKWILKIREVKEADMGWYMCQINTDPMKSQVAYLDVVGEYSHRFSPPQHAKHRLSISFHVCTCTAPIELITNRLLHAQFRRTYSTIRPAQIWWWRRTATWRWCARPPGRRRRPSRGVARTANRCL